jgi:hypothetical protein
MQALENILIGVFLLLVFFGPSVVCWLKGKRLWATLGWLTWWHLIPMVRLASPGSWRARRYYGADKLARAHARFPVSPTSGRGTR